MKTTHVLRHVIFAAVVCCLAVLFFSACRKQKPDRKISSIQDLNSSEFTIGGMTGAVASKEGRTKLPKANFKEYSMPIDAFTAICAGKIDAVVLDRPTLEFMSMAHSELAVMKDDIAVGHISIATAKKNQVLMDQINDFIRLTRRNGVYQQMYERWFRSLDPVMPEIVSPDSPEGTLNDGITANKEGGIAGFDGKIARRLTSYLDRKIEQLFHSLDPDSPEGTLKVGITANNEPVCFIKDGEIAGFDGEFARRLAVYLNRKIEFVDMPYDALTIGLASGKIDVAVAFMDADPEKEESVLFSEPYIDAPITIMIKKELLKKNRGIQQLSDLDRQDCMIAVQTEILATKEGKKKLPHASFMEFNGPTDCYVALSSGKANAVIYDRPALEYVAADREEFVVIPENVSVGQISIGINKKDKELLEQVNKFIENYKNDGTYQQMYDRWIYSRNPTMPEIKQPEKPNGTITIGIDSVNPPLSYVEQGKFTGFDIEFSYRLGAFLNKRVVLKNISYDGLVAALQGGKIDLIIAQMDATEEREDSVLFSKEYMDSSIAAMVRKKDYTGSQFICFNDLKGAKIGTLTGSAFDNYAKKYLPEYKSYSFSQVNQAVAALESRKIDGLFLDGPVARFLLLQRKKLTTMPKMIPCGAYAFCFAKENAALCNAFSQEIAKMKQEGMLEKLQNKWFSLDESQKIMPAPIESNKVLKCNMLSEMEPFGYIRDGKIVGYDVDLAIMTANRLGYHLEIGITDVNSMIESVKSGKCDFAGGCVTITKERQESVLFSEPDYDGGIAIVIRKNEQEKCPESLIGRIKTSGEDLLNSFQKTFIRESRWKLILQGLATTIVITVFSVILGTFLAFPICMMCRSKKKIPAWLGTSYVSLIMGTPILVILMILYYVIFAKVDINGIVVAIIAFGMDFAAYTSVTLRSGIDGIPRGQMEAALALGHTPHTAFFRFILPQAVRTILPVYRGEIISTLKSTSVVGYIAIMDLTKMGDIIRSRTYEAFFPLIAIALIYFLTAKCLTALLMVVENKLNPDTRRNRLVKRSTK